MRKLRNTLYLTQDNLYLYREGETIVIEKNKEKALQLPVHNLEGIVIFSHASVTPQVLELCSSHDIHVSYISHTGKYLVKIQNPMHGNVTLRRDQFRLSENEEESLKIAINLVTGKIFNSRIVLQRLVRDHKDAVDKDVIESVIASLQHTLNYLNNVESYQALLGKEGDSAKQYFSVFNQLILSNDEGFVFNGRSRRPPLDEINALLSYFYVLLTHEMSSALETVGLDPQVGFYHQIRSGRASLALDMIEELRPYLVDRFVVSIVNNRQVCKKDFEIRENGGVTIKDDARTKYLELWQARKRDIITHPYFKEKIEVGLIPYAQAQLMARFIRKDIDGYPPFLMR